MPKKEYKQTQKHKDNWVESRRRNGWFKNNEQTRVRMSHAKKGHEGNTLTAEHIQHIKESIASRSVEMREQHGRNISKARLKLKKERGYLNSTETRTKLKKALTNNPKVIQNRFKQILPVEDTKIEIMIQEFLKQLRIEFLTHFYISKIKYSYKCDIFIPVQEGITQKTIIECDGDYWHGNPEIFDFRELSKERKAQRCLDFERTAQLEEQGFRVIRLSESRIRTMNIEDFQQEVQQD